MNVVYPPIGHQTYEESSFLIGAVAPGQGLQIEGQLVPITAQGSFAWPVSLEFGENTLSLQVLDPKQQVLETRDITITRMEAISAPSASPLSLHPEIYAPQGTCVFRPGDWLEVSCLASPRAEASFTVPGLIETPVSMQATGSDGFVENRQPIFGQLHQTEALLPKQGFYQGAVQIPFSSSALDALPILIHLKNAKESQQFQLPGTTIHIRTQPVAAQVITDRAILRTQAPLGARFTPQREETRVWIDGEREGWSRLRLDDTQTAWIQTSDLEILSQAVKRSAALSVIQTHRLSAKAALIELFVPEQVPLQIEAEVDRLRIHLYNAHSQCDFIHYAPEDVVVQQIRWQQAGSNQVQIEIDVPRLCGFDYEYQDGAWLLTVKSLPPKPTEIVVLLDPGHGGEETGATGPTGIPEKDLNLSLSNCLKPLLEQAGFQVYTTREADTAISLEARTQQALDCEADIVLSLHHNALPDGRDPLQAQGASSYYYHTVSHPLARHLQTALVSELGLPDYGLFYDSLALTRIPSALSVLLELGFMTFPEEYDRLVDPAFQQQAAKTLAQAIQAFVLDH